VAWWDDGDDLFEEPRAPYPHVREVLRLRATQSGAALLTGGFARSVAVQQLVEDGALMPVQARADALRAAAPRVSRRR
jgi:primosomal protein N' (replication factor Y)